MNTRTKNAKALQRRAFAFFYDRIRMCNRNRRAVMNF